MSLRLMLLYKDCDEPSFAAEMIDCFVTEALTIFVEQFTDL